LANGDLEVESEEGGQEHKDKQQHKDEEGDDDDNLFN
jgi:hypothetical protein